MFGMLLSKVSSEEGGGAGGADAQSSSSSDPPVIEDEDAGALAFVNEWLGAIADAAVGLFVSQMVQIPVLSPSGRSQLVVDIEYIRYIKRAH
jgi:hypothetical protein